MKFDILFPLKQTKDTYFMTNLRIVPDNDAMNPRDNDNVCLMVCEHGRYSLGDKNAKEIMAKMLNVSPREHSVRELVAKVHEKDLVLVSKPLYLYDHSGITMSTSPFSCPFDSGQVGVIIAFKESIKNELSVKRIGKKVLQKMVEFANHHIDGEVTVYDQYISGEVYLLQEMDEAGEVMDTLGSFYGSDIKTNGMLDSIDESQKEALSTLNITYV